MGNLFSFPGRRILLLCCLFAFVPAGSERKANSPICSANADLDREPAALEVDEGREENQRGAKNTKLQQNLCYYLKKKLFSFFFLIISPVFKCLNSQYCMFGWLRLVEWLGLGRCSKWSGPHRCTVTHRMALLNIQPHCSSLLQSKTSREPAGIWCQCHQLQPYNDIMYTVDGYQLWTIPLKLRYPQDIS